MDFAKKLKSACDEGLLPQKTYESISQLYESYKDSVTSASLDMREYLPLFEFLFRGVLKQVQTPFPFQPFHQRITTPEDYFTFGIDFIRPLVDEKKSRVLGLDNIKKMRLALLRQENVVLFANHQTEVDPQLLSYALEDIAPEISTEIIFVAGDRVINDPLAIPFSMGRNLLCIYSKRHIDNPPEKKHDKQMHNQKTMRRMKELLTEGGKCVYVAPSGGRDRPNAEGLVEVAPFDASSIEMFRLMAKESKRTTHFYPLALVTFDILPPPNQVQKELGEIRRAKREGIQFFFGDEVDLDHFPGCTIPDRHERREALANFVWTLVKNDYNTLIKGTAP